MEPEMNNEATKDTGGVTTPTAAVRALVRAGQEKFAHTFTAKQQSFDSMIWDVRELNDRPSTQNHTHLYFTRYGTTNQALPQAYAEVVKSWLVLEGKSITNMHHRSDAARLLWEAIVLRRGNDPAAFAWRDLCEEDLSQTELLMQKHWVPGTVYAQGMQLLH